MLRSDDGFVGVGDLIDDDTVESHAVCDWNRLAVYDAMTGISTPPERSLADICDQHGAIKYLPRDILTFMKR